MSDASEDLYWRLHTLSKMLESSDIIDGTVHRDAYPTILDAMTAVRSAPIDERLKAFADRLMSSDTSDPIKNKMIEETERRIRRALIYGTSHPEVYTDIASDGGMDPRSAAPLPFAVFDEFGNGADDRVQDHIHEALNAYRFASAHALGAKEQDAADAKLMAALSPITDATYLGLAEDIARLTAEGEALKRFALAMLESWPLGDVDGGELQDEAVKRGLLVPEIRTEPCSEEGCNCAEYYSDEEWGMGITCYRKAPWLKEAGA